MSHPIPTPEQIADLNDYFHRRKEFEKKWPAWPYSFLPYDDRDADGPGVHEEKDTTMIALHVKLVELGHIEPFVP